MASVLQSFLPLRSVFAARRYFAPKTRLRCSPESRNFPVPFPNASVPRHSKVRFARPQRNAFPACALSRRLFRNRRKDQKRLLLHCCLQESALPSVFQASGSDGLYSPAWTNRAPRDHPKNWRDRYCETALPRFLPSPLASRRCYRGRSPVCES